MIQLDLGKILLGDTPTKNRYTRSAELLKAWQKEKCWSGLQAGLLSVQNPLRVSRRGLRERTGLMASWAGTVRPGRVRPMKRPFPASRLTACTCSIIVRPSFARSSPLFRPGRRNSLAPRLQGPPDPFIDYFDDDRIRHRIQRVTDPQTLRKAGNSSGTRSSTSPTDTIGMRPD